MRTHTAKSLRQFIKRIEQIKEDWESKDGEPDLWFRGSQKTSWPLVPKLYRPKAPIKDLLETEDEIREEFVRRAPSLSAYNPRNAWEWYFLMQHYAAPTRLLDWTEDPQIGLYFAVKDSEGYHDAAVWVLDPWRLNELVLGEHEVLPPGSDGLSDSDILKYKPWLPDRFDAKQRLKKRLPVAIFPNQFDRRIAAQRSCFTVHGVQTDSLEKLFPQSQKLFAKIVIPARAIENVRGELEYNSIDEATIYPDLEGLGKCVARWLMKDEDTSHDGLYTRLKPSAIEGVGVFAVMDIRKGTLLFSGDSDEMRWVRARDLPKEAALREFYDRFAIVKNGKDGRPKWYGCPRNFHRLTMSWYINDPKPTEKPNVRCDENYDFWALQEIKEGTELTVDSDSYSDHAKRKGASSTSGLKKKTKKTRQEKGERHDEGTTMTRKVFAAILIFLFGLTFAAPPRAAAQQSTGAQTLENRQNTTSSIQTMEMQNAPLAKCNVDQSTIVSGQVLHVRVRTENVPKTAKMMWVSADAIQIQPEGKEAVINTSGLTPGQHDVTVRTLLQGRIISCTVTFNVIVPPPPPPSAEGNYQQVKIFYATDRKETKTDDHASYSADEADGERMAYGYAFISIPRDHRMAEMERPSMWKLEFREDPNKHVVVLDTVAEDQKTFLQGVQKHLADKNSKEVLIFVHGYDNTFEDAERRLGQITYDLGFGGASILYSWPSRGNLAAYAADEESVAWSTPHFKRFLEFVVDKTGASAIHIIAHSMGNRALAGALRQISDERGTLSPRLQEIVLAAPDINVSIFNQLAKALSRTANHFTIYESSKDWALFESHAYHHFIRVGDSDPHINIVDGYDAIDATNVDTGLLGHSYFAESKSILADIYWLIRGKSGPDTRFGLQHESYINQTYWAFRK